MRDNGLKGGAQRLLAMPHPSMSYPARAGSREVDGGPYGKCGASESGTELR
jgi:hypothetical protein